MEFQSTPSTRRETPRFPQQSDRRGLFQSTPSTRRETGREPTIYGGVFISIHSLHTEGDDLWGGGEERNQISIHSLHTEGDPLPVPRKMQLLHFNPLPPHGGRLSHAPQMLPLLYFNPLPPHGGRPRKTARSVVSEIFQSTPSTRRETAKLHRKAFFISPILVQSCKKGCKRLHSAPEKMIFFEKREKNSVRNLQHLSVRL